MPYSYLSHLRCSKSGEIHDADQAWQLSRAGAPLLASYGLDALKKVWHPAALLGRPASLWRYHELLPVRDPTHVVTLGEGFTPLLRLPTLGKQIIERIYASVLICGLCSFFWFAVRSCLPRAGWSKNFNWLLLKTLCMCTG
jgi:threonine synthase